MLAGSSGASSSIWVCEAGAGVDGGAGAGVETGAGDGGNSAPRTVNPSLAIGVWVGVMGAAGAGSGCAACTGGKAGCCGGSGAVAGREEKAWGAVSGYAGAGSGAAIGVAGIAPAPCQLDASSGAGARAGSAP